jgi:hypothetical protein
MKEIYHSFTLYFKKGQECLQWIYNSRGKLQLLLFPESWTNTLSIHSGFSHCAPVYVAIEIMLFHQHKTAGAVDK